MHQKLYIILSFICLFFFNQAAAQQCNFSVDVSVTKISDCESNGIIKAVLKGSDVNNGYIQLSDAKYSIASTTSGGYTKTFDVNGGVLQGVPPGTYTITAEAYCTRTNSWVMYTSQPITMTGTYPGFDINKIMIETANMKKSLMCSPTGSIPIRLGSGKKPYYVEIIQAPDPSLIGNIYSHPGEGTLTITNIPAGDYRFSISDDCGYTIFMNTLLDSIIPEYKVLEIAHTPVCVNDGKIKLSLKNGTLPYTMTITGAPAGYSGPTTITIPTDGDYTLSNLPQGSYKYTINDQCHPQSFTSVINEIKPEALIINKTSSVSCNGEGSITIRLRNGYAPYTITTTSCPAACPFTSINVSTAKDTTITGLFPGTYVFNITDQCNSTILTHNVAIDTLKMRATLASKTDATGCGTNDGRARINVTGGTTPYVTSMVNETTGMPVTVPSGPPYNFSNLPEGNYKFLIQDACSNVDSVKFTIDRDPLQATVAYGVTPTYICAGIGSFTVNIIKGKPGYKVEITGPVNDTKTSNSKEFVFENLKPGSYDIIVTDACNDTVRLKTLVETLIWNNNANLYQDYFYPLNPPDSDCNRLLVQRRKPTGQRQGSIEWLWTNHPNLFEVAFVPSNDLTSPWVWRNISDIDTVIFPNPTDYCDARTNGYTFEAKVRFKASTECDTITDIIRFRPLSASATARDITCDDFTLVVTHNDKSYAILCYPANYYVVNTTTNDTIRTGQFNNLNDIREYNVPNGDYRVVFRDRLGCEWMTSGVSTASPVPKPPVVSTGDRDCDTYSVSFQFQEKCYPYSWILYERDNPSQVLASMDIPNAAADLGSYKETGLRFGVNYRLCILGNQKRDTICTNIYETRVIHRNYRMDFTPSYCLPDTAKGYIRLFRSPAAGPDAFEQGSIIRFVSGPTTPIHAEDTIKTSNVKEFFPFSQDSSTWEWQMIEEGPYVFEIIDTCGIVHTIHKNYKKSNVVNFGYTSDEGCVGMNIKTEGHIWLGDSLQLTSYFRIRTTPPGVASIDDIVTTGGYLLLRETGRYTLQISTDNGINSCPFDTLVIDFVKQTLSLDADSTITYVCDEGSDGYIRVMRKGGVGPFTYELFDKGISIGKNTTGEFFYGRFGESYVVRITDEGCGVSFPVDVYMLDISKERLINDDIRICKGSPIELKSVSIGTYSGYLWTGPNSYTSTDQNPTILDATNDMDGKYSITLHPKGCSRFIHQDVNVRVIDPLPLPDTTLFYCINDVPEPLKAKPEPGNILKWYSTDTVHVASAPIPPTNKADTLDYFVSQVDAMLGCEGEKARIRIIIEAFPDTVAYAFSNDICPNNYPLITIPETFDSYVYRLYSAAGMEIAKDTAVGDTLRIHAPIQFPNSGHLFIEVETKHRCVSQGKSIVPVNVVNPPQPIVYDVLYCLHDNADALIADSTAGNRLQWYDSGMTPLVTAPVPPTNVAGDFFYYVSQVDTLLGCEGKTSELMVRIINLPDTLILAQAADICQNSSPEVIVNRTYLNYTYTLFTATNDTIAFGIADGTPLRLFSSNFTLSHSDTLYVEIKNQHRCTAPDRSVVPINVIISPTPEAKDTMYCVGDWAMPLEATPSFDHYLQWYDLNGNPVNTAPVPSTLTADTLMYSVSQVHAVLGCESERVPIRVVVIGLPDTVAAVAPPVCPGQYPTVKVIDALDGFTYNVYSITGALVGTGQGPADTLRIQVSVPIQASTYFYVETVNPNNCASKARTVVFAEVINYVWLLPESIPEFQRGREYTVQLETNAVSPYVFSTADLLPFGFSLSVDGLIHGNPPVNGLIDPIPFTVKVLDANGCFAEMPYVLESELFIPQVFTPNGDGKNDVFMKNRRLVIFDRLGLKIFEGNDGWDGSRMDGTQAPPDTYFYLLFYMDDKLMTEGQRKGSITLVRGN